MRCSLGNARLTELLGSLWGFGPSEEPGSNQYTMRLKLFDYLAIATLAVSVIAAGYIAFAPALNQADADPITYNELNTQAIWIGKDLPTTISSSTGRTYLEIQNEGATTSTSIYCQTNGRVGAPYTGFTLSPTTTRKFTSEEVMYRGSLSCRALSASTTIFVIDQ